MKYKNYYNILELQSARATEEEIKSAYRRLAKKYHPDLNEGNDQASEKFKDINEAYQILGDEIARKKYDRVHFAYKFRDGFSANTSKNFKKGASDFISMVFGSKSENVTTNFDKYYDKAQKEQGERLESEIDITLEEAFFGAERKIAFKTIENKMKTITISIPRGMHSGEVIRLAGQGKPGKNGGEPGDFYITVNIIPHAQFKIVNNDLQMELLIAPWEAVFGCDIEINGIEDNILLNVPPCSQSGDKLRIANEGYINETGNRGDLILTLKIMVPHKLNEEERKLFLKFKDISNYNPRKN